MRMKLYSPTEKEEWDKFVTGSKNGTFLLYRDFIEYHGNRFNDYSLMFYRNDKLMALLPGHISGKDFHSHMGLTYAGLIMGGQTTASDVLEIFKQLTHIFRHQGIKRIVYKAIPHIYHRQPAEEDLYALHYYKAVISERKIASCIYMDNKPPYSPLRKRGVNKAMGGGLAVEKSEGWPQFWQVLSSYLKEKYDADPVHSLEEIIYLKDKFPRNIHLYIVLSPQKDIVGGTIVFETETVARIQYIVSTTEGKRMGATDFLIDHIINKAFPDKAYFDYGTSLGDDDYGLNTNLMHSKEGFGARAIVFDTYTIHL
ncbi:GNAT family N-acetyltransferase [Dysgonomonas sp. 511]|nr:GNAT family N-acetyltransferase [Dysgonomonas sp. 511]